MITIRNTRQVYAADGTAAAPSIAQASSSSTGWYFPTANRTAFSILGTPKVDILSSGFRLASDMSIRWTDTTNAFTGSSDLVLHRDGAGILSQRNATNGQTFRLFNTYTNSGTDYERGGFSWATNVLSLLTEQGGTGTARTLQIGTSGSASLKFVTLNTAKWSVTAAGHILAEVDSGYDIGASGSSRPRNIYSGASIDAATSYKVAGTQVVGARVTGWAAASGTATRTTFNTATVLTSALAERVKALIDDLITHGVIGS